MIKILGKIYRKIHLNIIFKIAFVTLCKIMVYKLLRSVELFLENVVSTKDEAILFTKNALGQ